MFSGVTQSLPLTGEVARQRRDGGGVVYIHDKNCIIKLKTALSTTSWSPSPVSGRLADSVRKHTAKQEFTAYSRNSVEKNGVSLTRHAVFHSYFSEMVTFAGRISAWR